jgi:hypothetical protein
MKKKPPAPISATADDREAQGPQTLIRREGEEARIVPEENSAPDRWRDAGGQSTGSPQSRWLGSLSRASLRLKPDRATLVPFPEPITVT